MNIYRLFKSLVLSFAMTVLFSLTLILFFNYDDIVWLQAVGLVIVLMISFMVKVESHANLQKIIISSVAYILGANWFVWVLFPESEVNSVVEMVSFVLMNNYLLPVVVAFLVLKSQIAAYGMTNSAFLWVLNGFIHINITDKSSNYIL